MKTNNKRPPRYSFRDIPYRPSREVYSYENGYKLIKEFFIKYVWPHNRQLFFYLFCTTLTACSVYLMSYYGRLVVDDVLMINVPEIVQSSDRKTSSQSQLLERAPKHRLNQSPIRQIDSARDNEHSTRYHDGKISESFRDSNASRRPPNAGIKLFGIFIIYLATVVILNYLSKKSVNSRHWVAHKMTIALREDIHKKIIGLSSGYLQSTTPGRLMSRILADVDAIQAHLLNILAIILSQTIMFFVGLIILFCLDVTCGIAVIITAIPYCIIMDKNRRDQKVFQRESAHTNACLWGLVSQKLDAVKAIFAYAMERVEILNFFRLSATLQRDSLESQKLGAQIGRVSQLLTAFCTQGIFIYCTIKVLNGEMTLGQMMFINGAAVNIFTPINQLTVLSTTIAMLLTIMQRVSYMLNNPNEILDTSNAKEFPSSLKSGISIRNLNFKYSEKTGNILSDISIEIPAGSSICITGPSGAGKTTLLNMIMRLYEYNEGEILIDNIPLTEFSQKSLHQNMALVPQEAQIISGTVRNNIIYGYPEAQPSEIMNAARAADCHDFIMNLPVKYETIIGEKGMTLSGGQRQRISIARALITNPEILVLDDCTSALDAKTEQKLQETFAKIMNGKTCVIVSQRVSMAMRCDKIYVIENGTITESGNHQELINNNGFYSNLYKTQTSASANH